MHRRIVTLTAGLVVAAGALVPAAHAQYYVPREQPPQCETAVSNVVLGDPFCEETELEP